MLSSISPDFISDMEVINHRAMIDNIENKKRIGILFNKK